MTQSQMFEHLQASTLLNASLWINIALAGLSILLFVYMGRNVEDPRAQLIWVATLMVPLVSISSYTGLASGLTMSVLEMPAGHALHGETLVLADGTEIQNGAISLWGRYLTWALSTPFILLALGLLANTNFTKLFTALVADISIMITGLAAALTTSSYLMRWMWYFISVTFFLAVVYILLVEWPKDARAAGTEEIFNLLKVLTVVLWFGYTIWWAVGNEGLALIESVAITSWGYSLFDVVAKYGFAFLLLNWVASNEGVVAEHSSGSGSGAAAPADD
ncbi:MAG: bacteriorhodopsin [Haloferacaceae archaeon]